MEDDKKKVEEIINDEKKDLTNEDVTEDPKKDDPNSVDDPEKGKNPDEEQEAEKKKQSREENARFAELRRKNAELEKKNKELEEEAVKASFDAKKENISKATLASIGLDAIETEDDLLLARAYDNAVASGSEEPLRDAVKVQREHMRKRAEKVREEEQARKAMEEKVKQDQIEFKKKFGIETADVMKNDKKFVALFGDLIEPGNFTKLYTRFKTEYPDESGEDGKNKGIIPNSSNKQTLKPPKKELHELDGDEFLKAYNEKYYP
ncbi:MAG: hypothetical protein M0Q41_10755 [Bacteroidales bacterium]|nr:hypothetical protein [Acholeplasmataceae bacterium]MCK9449441.1 hypothetical protein [Bacteroidales bacterium]